jgi:transcriptional regulator with XRE-family HTH domain
MAKVAGPVIRERFGIAVRMCLEVLGLTEEDSAERAAMHQTYLSDIEKGSRSVSLLNNERMASALSMEISKLFRQAERP